MKFWHVKNIKKDKRADKITIPDKDAVTYDPLNKVI